MSGGLKFLITFLVLTIVLGVPALLYFKKKRDDAVSLLEQSRTGPSGAGGGAGGQPGGPDQPYQVKMAEKNKSQALDQSTENTLDQAL